MSARDAKGRFQKDQYELVWWDGFRGYDASSRDVKKREPVEVLLFGPEYFVAVRKSGAVQRLPYSYRESSGWQRTNRILVKVA